MADTDVPFRILPELDDTNRAFWQGGADGALRFWRCQACAFWIHPPLPVCPMCHSKDLAVEAVSGRATLATFTINHQPWMPGPELPYAVAIVELVEQVGLRLTTNLINCPLDDVRSGMAVRVVFEHHADPAGDGDDVWLPLFEPDPDSAAGGAR
jgi:uncharacterized OB-fold protein